VEAFHLEHERTYGHRSQKDQVHLVNARLTARIPVDSHHHHFAAEPSLRRQDRVVAFSAGADAASSVAVIGRGDLDKNFRKGPFVVEEYDCTCVIGPQQTARLDDVGNIEIALEAA